MKGFTLDCVVQLHNAVAEMEKEKFDLQKRHTENIQELLEDTNIRLSKMEGEYVAQTLSTVSNFFSLSITFLETLFQFPCAHASVKCI